MSGDIPMTLPQLVGIIAGCAVFGLIHIGLWLVRDRRRHNRLAPAANDPTPPDEDLMAVAELVDVDPEPTYPAPADRPAVTCPHCAEPLTRGSDGHYTTYCRVSRAIEPFHNCCPTGCELRPVVPRPTLRAETVPATAEAVLAARPYVMGGWVQVGASRVHRGCSEARRDGRRICGYCSPFLVGSASPAAS